MLQNGKSFNYLEEKDIKEMVELKVYELLLDLFNVALEKKRPDSKLQKITADELLNFITIINKRHEGNY